MARAVFGDIREFLVEVPEDPKIEKFIPNAEPTKTQLINEAKLANRQATAPNASKKTVTVLYCKLLFWLKNCCNYFSLPGFTDGIKAYHRKVKDRTTSRNRLLTNQDEDENEDEQSSRTQNNSKVSEKRKVREMLITPDVKRVRQLFLLLSFVVVFIVSISQAFSMGGSALTMVSYFEY